MSDAAGPLILEMHRIDGPDKSPMQMVSTDLLAHYRRCEAELVALKAGSRGAAGRPDILDACTVLSNDCGCAGNGGPTEK